MAVQPSEILKKLEALIASGMTLQQNPDNPDEFCVSAGTGQAEPFYLEGDNLSEVIDGAHARLFLEGQDLEDDSGPTNG